MNYEETTLDKLLNGINHTLNIANKALPVYNQAKPLVKKGFDTYNNIKTNGNNITNMVKLLKVKNQIKKDMNKKNLSIPNFHFKNKQNYNNINNPKFFI